jgi:hypothetical protein
MRKYAVAALGVIALLAAVAPSAGAAKPVREFVPASDFTITGSCPFDVGVHILANNEHALTFQEGATLVTGTLKVRLTNLSNPQNSIDLNIPGPGLSSVSDNGTFTLDARGPWLFFYPGVLRYTTGHVIFTVSPAGVISLTQLGGTRTDLCAALT